MEIKWKAEFLTIEPPDGSERYEAGRATHASVGIAALHFADKPVPSDFSNSWRNIQGQCVEQSMGTYALIRTAASYFADNDYHAVLSEFE
jgi:hypothetical protein